MSLVRKKPLLPGKPLKGFRKKRRPGNRPMTKAEHQRVMDAKEGHCCPCVVWARAGNMPMADIARLNQYDHSVSGRIRRGHGKGFASCDWHHQGLPSQGWNSSHMRSHFGPSLMDGSKPFHAAYGSDDELIELQTRLNEGETP